MKRFFNRTGCQILFKRSNFAAKKGKMKDKFTYMTTAPIPRLVGSLAIPTIISMLVTAFYNIADTYFVGKINTQATAAVGIVFSIMTVIQAIGFFFGHGSGNYISRKLGARDTENAEKMAANGFFLAFFAGVFLMIVGWIFLTPLAKLLGSTPTILPYTRHYLSIILVGTPFMTASLVLNNQMRFQGNAVYAMVGIIIGAVINIALDPLLIFTFGWGIRGAAVATAFSQICSFFVLFYMDGKGSNIRIRWRNFTPTRAFISEIIKGGTPSLGRQGLGSVSTICLNVAAGAYGDAAIAGMSIVTRITIFINAFVIGFGQGFQPVCGFNYGAGIYSRVKAAFWFCVRIGTVFLTLCAIVGFWKSPELISLFRKGDPAVIEVGTAALRWQLISLPLNAWIVLCNMMLQTIRKPVQATLMASSRQGLFFIPLIILLPQWLGLFGVEISQAIADLFSAIVAIPLTKKAWIEMRKDKVGE